MPHECQTTDRWPRVLAAGLWTLLTVVLLAVALVALSLPAGAGARGAMLSERAAAPLVDTFVSTSPPPSAATSPTRAADRVSDEWLSAVGARTQIPVRALEAYATAHLTVSAESPDCALGWSTLAAIGNVESQHGSYRGAVMGPDGRVRPSIIGIALDGAPGVAGIRDTDAGLLDGDTRWDRAVGPMQFIPSTWARWAADGDGDGVTDPQDLDDGALAAARYLCAGGGQLTRAGAWHRAVLSYNASESYVARVLHVANAYAVRSQG